MLRDFYWNFGADFSGVIHVGANIGEERFEYAEHNLNVLWFEPNPISFKILKDNIAEFPKQKAFPFLILDEDDREYLLHLANNDGASSSILERTGHKVAWPNVSYVSDVLVKGLTLNTFFKRYEIDKKSFQFLSIDTEGTELSVLKGATDILPFIQFAEIEVMDFDVYRSNPTIEEINNFMESFGFIQRKLCLQCVAEIGNGRCYNALYVRP